MPAVDMRASMDACLSVDCASLPLSPPVSVLKPLSMRLEEGEKCPPARTPARRRLGTYRRRAGVRHARMSCVLRKTRKPVQHLKLPAVFRPGLDPALPVGGSSL